MKNKIHARDILRYSNAQEVWTNLPEKFNLIFDDEVTLEVTNKNTLYSHYFWLFHKNYPKTPLLSTHHVASILKGKSLTSNTHIQLLEQINKDVVDTYKIIDPGEQEKLLGLIYSVTNKVFNEITKFAEEYVTSIDILDFIEVIEYPPIKAANDGTLDVYDSIYDTYRKINDTINNDPNLQHNSLVKAVKSKMVNANQVSQCIGVRGFVTEVDGSILKVPIMSNFTQGMNSLYYFIAESRSAAKALYFSEAPLQDAEYFARRLQLNAMVVEKINRHDCGTTKHLPWRISPPKVDEKGSVEYPGDLKFLVGKYYLDDESSEYKEIKGDETYLYNKLIKMRSVLFCEEKDPHSVCAVCFGGLFKNVSQFANLGHLCSVMMTLQTTQSVLSTKHLDASSVSANIVLNDISSKYLTTNKAKNAYIVKKELKDKDVRIVIDRDSAIGLTDVINIEDFNNINPLRVSSIESFDFIYRSKGEDQVVPIFVSQGKRKAILTSEFLEYLKKYRWETDGKNNFVFSLSNWDFTIPVMKLPDMEYSFSDHSKEIAQIIESSMKNILEREKPDSAVSTLQELFLKVNSKLSVNIAALEIIIYASMIPGKNNYDLARNYQNPCLGVADQLVYNRSLAPAYAYEKHGDIIPDPKSFFKLNRPSSLFDVFLDPKAVVENYNQGRI